MAKVKPYIITVKYAAFYADPAPTVDQILNELNIDAMEISIEEAVVSAAPKVEAKPNVEYDAESRTVTYHNLPEATVFPAQVTTRKKKGVVEYGFDTKHIELKGPSVAILHTLQTLGPKTLTQVREITNRYDTTMQVSMSRLKARGRVSVVGAEAGKSLYAFVK